MEIRREHRIFVNRHTAFTTITSKQKGTESNRRLYKHRLRFSNGYMQLKFSPLLPNHPPSIHHSYSLQEKSSKGTGGKSATDLDVGSSASELRRRRRVSSSTGGSSSARGASSATHDRLGGLGGDTRVSSANGHLIGDRGGVRSRAGDGVGGGCRGGVVREERGDGHGHNAGAALLGHGGGSGVVGSGKAGESSDGGEELHFG